jgi:hypothetical protein
VSKVWQDHTEKGDNQKMSESSLSVPVQDSLSKELSARNHVQCTLSPKILTTYGKPQYNYVKGDRQRIELHRGCPWQHEYCYEPKIVEDFPIPKLVRNHVEILDMNPLARKDFFDILIQLAFQKVNGKLVYYEAICGFDFRFLTQKIADKLKRTRFLRPRLAWDGSFSDQYKIKDAINMLIKAGYKRNETSLFMIVNWKIPYRECLRKLDLMKVWNVKVCDCCYDGGYKYATPTFWTREQLTKIRRICRKHNQLVLFGIDPQPTIEALP